MTDENNNKLSKTAKKRAMTSVQNLGERLMELSDEQLRQLELTPDLTQAVLDAKTMTKHEALRRQKQYIGKLMRHIDTERIEEMFLRIDGFQALENQRFHLMERLRDRMLNEEKEAYDQALEMFPMFEVQQARSLVRQAKKEQSKGKPPHAARALFRYLRSLERP